MCGAIGGVSQIKCPVFACTFSQQPRNTKPCAVQWDVGGGAVGGSSGWGAPLAPATPTRRAILRASAQPFVPRVGAPAFVPAGISTDPMSAGMGGEPHDQEAQQAQQGAAAEADNAAPQQLQLQRAPSLPVPPKLPEQQVPLLHPESAEFHIWRG